MKRLTGRSYVSLFVSLLTTCLAGGHAAASLQDDWDRFQKNPRAFMERDLLKRDAEGNPIPRGSDSSFSKADIRSKSFIKKKVASRAQVTGQANRPNPLGPADVARFSGEPQAALKLLSFFDMSEFSRKNIRPVHDLAEMERLQLRSATLAESPWSSSYFPIYQGILGARYAARNFQGAGSDWASFYDATLGDNSLAAIVARGNPVELETLSPSEKYDLLIGDPRARPADVNGFLTPRMWQEGNTYMSTYGNVESWMGICHGWAPASFMVMRPRKPVRALASVENADVKLYPEDVKGLTSYLWAKARTDVGFLGERCHSKTPQVDPMTGRVLDNDCFDVNPGIWHMAIVNQIGQAKRSMIIDATFDYEVWNQPVHAYSYRYFNPQTGRETDSIAEAKVSRAEFTKDKFAKFRSSDAVAFVGVEMTLTYVAETASVHAEVDSAEDDALRTVHYMYDLEVNANGEIIGGEWYSRQHPDFLWLPKQDAKAISPGDQGIPNPGEWRPENGLPAFWRGIAVATATRYGQPLAAVIDRLIEAAQ